MPYVTAAGKRLELRNELFFGQQFYVTAAEISRHLNQDEISYEREKTEQSPRHLRQVRAWTKSLTCRWHSVGLGHRMAY